MKTDLLNQYKAAIKWIYNFLANVELLNKYKFIE